MKSRSALKIEISWFSRFREALSLAVQIQGAGQMPFGEFVRRADIQQLDAFVVGKHLVKRCDRKVGVTFAGEQAQEGKGRQAGDQSGHIVRIYRSCKDNGFGGIPKESGNFSYIYAMFKVSDPLTTPPPAFATPLQQKVYETFGNLDIPFERVDTDPGLTMEDCAHIDAKIGVRIVKTVFLCNRQQTEFYLYVTTDDKPFVTREFCGALGIPRVSFAPAERLQALTGVTVGATTILSAILPEAAGVHLVMDRAVAESDWFACTDGTATCFVKIRTVDLLARYLPASGHSLTLV